MEQKERDRKMIPEGKMERDEVLKKGEKSGCCICELSASSCNFIDGQNRVIWSNQERSRGEREREMGKMKKEMERKRGAKVIFEFSILAPSLISISLHYFLFLSHLSPSHLIFLRLISFVFFVSFNFSVNPSPLPLSIKSWSLKVLTQYKERKGWEGGKRVRGKGERRKNEIFLREKCITLKLQLMEDSAEQMKCRGRGKNIRMTYDENEMWHIPCLLDNFNLHAEMKLESDVRRWKGKKRKREENARKEKRGGKKRNCYSLYFMIAWGILIE